MGLINVHSFVAGNWLPADDGARPIASAVTGEPLAIAGQASLDTQSMIDFARLKGGPALRAMTFHDRARMLKALALELGKFKDELYALSYTTGATKPDSMIDIDGGIGTMLVYASKGRREMPDGHIYVDGDLEMLSRNGSFVGQHVATSLQGVAVHINAFNFPVWGMLEKLAPTLLAGMPAIVKPATATCHVTEQCVRRMIESGILPEGAVQLVSGGLGDLLDRLDYQDVVGFTGSAKTALMLRSNPHLLENSVRFVAEQDSLNASVLGPDVTPDSPEFDILVKEVVREMTAKAGQKCTAIRRIIVPQALIGPVGEAIAASSRQSASATRRWRPPAWARWRPPPRRPTCSTRQAGSPPNAASSLAVRRPSRSTAPTRPRGPSSPRCCLPATIPMRLRPSTRSRPSARSRR
jgi:oxepin-CoA hydrolase/3-oxo-5,6-dehydrosuberyl-CoA semialdehyde dehydrogenase